LLCSAEIYLRAELRARFDVSYFTRLPVFPFKESNSPDLASAHSMTFSPMPPDDSSSGYKAQPFGLA
jgi:hypothetical protein